LCHCGQSVICHSFVTAEGCYHYCPHLNPELKESRAQRRAVLQVQKLDPFNPQTYLPLNDASGLRNENYTALDSAPAFANPKDFPGMASPEVKSYTLNSKLLHNQRTVQIYQSKRANPAGLHYCYFSLVWQYVTAR
jgi:enterochelin esterase family protein